MGIEPVPIKMYGDPDADKKFKKTVILSEIIRMLFRKELILMGIRKKICIFIMENLI